MGWFSLTTLLSGVCLAYVAHSIWTIFNIYHIPACDSKVSECLQPWLFRKSASGKYINKGLSLVLYGSRYSTVSEGSKVDLLYSNTSFDVFSSHEISINVTLSSKAREDGKYYLHMYVVPPNVNALSGSAKIAYSSTKMTQLSVPKLEAFNLMGGNKTETIKEPKQSTDKTMPHWRSRVTVSLVTDDVAFDKHAFPHEIIRYVRNRIDWDTMSYYPIAVVDKLSFRIRDLELIKKDKEVMPLTVLYQPMSAGKLRFWETITQSFDQLKTYGFGDKDIDEVKGIFADTNFYFLCLTFAVSAVHILFDALAFKNDISYWKNRKTMVGLSSRGVVWRCVSSIIIFFYLMDSDTSLLVTIPAGISAVIEVWKLKKAFKVSFSFSRPFISFGDSSDKERETDEFDAKAMSYLSYLLIPLVIGGAIYSLLYVPHKSWYSWCLQSLVYGIYAFGFLFMLPQLFVNYKLKSVAHLPWRAFMYKAFNTFIDDIFAFIITMPTAHRVACFRDDLVFVIYLYQRWLYPVDKSRVNEFGQSFDDDGTTPQSEGDASGKKKTE